jgi:hypothetical protein
MSCQSCSARGARLLKHIEIFGSSFFDFSYNPLLKFINLGNVGFRFFDDYLAYALIFSLFRSIAQ